MNDNAASSRVTDSYAGLNGVYYAGAGAQNTSTGSTSGLIGKSLLFDGVNEFVSIADNSVFSPVLKPFSISAWVYMVDATSFTIASKGVVDTNGEWAFYTQAGDLLLFAAFDESQSKLGADVWIGRFYSVALTTLQNAWLMLTATYDGGLLSTGIKLYLNNIRIDDTTTEQLGIPFQGVENGNGAVFLGKYGTTANGAIDNVMFFNHELNLEEINRLYNNYVGAEASDLDSKTSARRIETANMPTRVRY